MKSIEDEAIEMIMESINEIGLYLDDVYKDTDPLGMVKVSDKDAISEYLSYSPETVQRMRIDIPEVWENYENQIGGAKDRFRRQSNG